MPVVNIIFMNNRRSIRINNYDYSQNNFYFVTICTDKTSAGIFGYIVDERTILSDIGKIAEEYIEQIPKHFPNTTIDEFIVMPDHVHLIIIIDDDHCSRGTIYRAPTKIEKFGVSKSGTLSRIVSVYKAAVTRDVNRNKTNNRIRIWQKNYYEHVIRGEKELQEIRRYIKNNPINVKNIK